jgi:hypothetical protein
MDAGSDGSMDWWIGGVQVCLIDPTDLTDPTDPTDLTGLTRFRFRFEFRFRFGWVCAFDLLAVIVVNWGALDINPQETRTQ